MKWRRSVGVPPSGGGTGGSVHKTTIVILISGEKTLGCRSAGRDGNFGTEDDFLEPVYPAIQNPKPGNRLRKWTASQVDRHLGLLRRRKLHP